MEPNNNDNAQDSAWYVVFQTYDPADEGRREALCALGNGYFVTRAANSDATADDTHYPGTYRAGCYNRLTSCIQGQQVDNESLVNLPNWLPLTFRCAGENRWFSLDTVEILDYRQILNLQHGLLRREIRFRDAGGRQTRLCEERLVSMAHPHLAGLTMEITAENWSGELEIRSALDGRVINDNVKRFRPYSKNHLEPLKTDTLAPDGILLKVRTHQSRTEIALAARTRVCRDQDELNAVSEIDQEVSQIAEHIRCRADTGIKILIEKIVALYTSHDPALSESEDAARQAIQCAPDFANLLDAHRRTWQRLWERCDIHLDRPEQLRALRLHTFHILQTTSPHTADLDVGIPSRGWHGEAYRGQIFWDELFVFPFLTLRFPNLTRSLLLYRYRRLPEARRAAQENGYRGAMFPWRSASNGREETPTWQLNPLSGRWMPDHTHLQRHIGAAVAYNVWHYITTTDDDEFLGDYGAELVLEIARFWASIATYNQALDRFEIHGVIGPDEYQNTYPQADTPGVNNNTYTNLMAVWTLCRALEVFSHLPPQRGAELWRALKLRQEELDHWDAISRKMRIVFQNDGILSQFEGVEHLQELDLEKYHQHHGNQRIDWVLEAEGDSVDNYQITKQADVLTLFYLLSEAEVTALLNRLGYSFNHDIFKRTVAHYLHRTTHESSLSRVVYAGALAQVNPCASWQYFEQALATDLFALKGQSTAEGIHLGAMAGTIDVLQRHYLGLGIQKDAVYVNPSLPQKIEKLHICLHYRRNELEFETLDSQLQVSAAPTNAASVKLIYKNQTESLKPGASLFFTLTKQR